MLKFYVCDFVNRSNDRITSSALVSRVRMAQQHGDRAKEPMPVLSPGHGGSGRRAAYVRRQSAADNNLQIIGTGSQIPGDFSLVRAPGQCRGRDLVDQDLGRTADLTRVEQDPGAGAARGDVRGSA